jgi:hypothetical protein
LVRESLTVRFQELPQGSIRAQAREPVKDIQSRDHACAGRIAPRRDAIPRLNTPDVTLRAARAEIDRMRPFVFQCDASKNPCEVWQPLRVEI